MKAQYLLWTTLWLCIVYLARVIGSSTVAHNLPSDSEISLRRKLNETEVDTANNQKAVQEATSSPTQEATQSTTQETSNDDNNKNSSNEEQEKPLELAKSNVTEQSRDSVIEEEIKKEIMYNKILKLSSNNYGGRWIIDNPDDKTKIYQQMNSISGIDKVEINFYRMPFMTPTMRIINIMYDGEYRDRVIYQKISLSDFNMTDGQNEGIKVFQKKANIEVSYGRLYSIFADHNCYADVTAEFISGRPGDEVKLLLTINSDGTCFPKKTTVDVKYPDSAQISKIRVIHYVIILNIMLMIYCFVINKQCNEAEQNHPIATRISMTMLSWNTIWNFCLFNIHLSYALQVPDYGYLAIPACMYFILCFIFELKLLLICWKAKNLAMFAQGNEAVRRALITFYIKFYLVALISLLTVEKIVCTPILLFLLCGSTLIPQIIENAINKARNAPNLSFATFMMLTQCFFALYIRGCPSNVMQLESNLNWALYFFCYILAQLVILYFQRKFGSRFFIPKICRFWNEFNYYKKFDEDLEDGNNQDGGITCCIHGDINKIVRERKFFRFEVSLFNSHFIMVFS